jgi:hypothetical protein
MELWEPKPPGTLWATPGQLRDCFTFIIIIIIIIAVVIIVVIIPSSIPPLPDLSPWPPVLTS